MESLSARRRAYVFGNELHVTPVTKDQIHGIDGRLAEIEKIISRLKNFRTLQSAGVDIGGGALFYGPTGAGKTYCAGYLVEETKEVARFVDIGSFPRRKSDEEEAELTQGHIRELFRLSEEFVKEHQKPIILFYDEFEKASEDIIEELILQLCGIRKKENGIYLLLLSTDDLSDIDERLLRPGRVSDHIAFTSPRLQGKIKILAYHVGYRPHEPEIDFESVAFLFEDEATPAFIARLVEMAHIDACTEEGRDASIKEKHLLYYAIHALTGTAAEEHFSEEGRYLLAVHEAGHALFAHFLGIPVQIVSILPQVRSSFHGGVDTAPPPEMLTSSEAIEKLMVFRLGGIMAERILGFPDRLTSENDLADIMNCVSMMVERLGCGKEMRQRYGYFVASGKDNSDALRRVLESDEAIILKRIEKKAEALIRRIGEKRARTHIKTLAQVLLQKKIILSKELADILET